MTAPYDPRATRPNVDLPRLLRRIRREWRSFERAPTDAQRRGRAAILNVLLEEYLEEPAELPPDLRPGARDPAPAYLPVGAFEPGDAPFLPAYPFDAGGPGRGQCFFMYGQTRISPLYEGPSRDPWPIAALHDAVYFVHSLELIHASPTPTSNHLADPRAFERLGWRTELPHAPYLVLADPAGVAGAGGYGVELAVASREDARSAIAAADQWSEALGIRFVVAVIRHSADMH